MPAKMTASIAELTSGFENFLKAKNSDIIMAAASGWQYSKTLDGRFIEPSLNLESKKSLLEEYTEDYFFKKNEKNQNLLFNDHLSRLKNLQHLPEKWDYAGSLVRGEPQEILFDSYRNIQKKFLKRALTKSVNGNDLNIVILGAGCIGVALANALKMGLGEKVNILIIENRVYERHLKKPYRRKWLTHIPVHLLTGVFDPDVVSILEGFGTNGYIGAKLNLIETLLMISSVKLGVKFFFDPDYDLSFIEKTNTHIIFDATGGKLSSKYITQPDNNLEISVNMEPMANAGTNSSAHHTTNDKSTKQSEIKLKEFNHKFFPHYKNQKIIIGMLKITGIPITLQQTIDSFVKENNSDNMFYIYKGQLLPQFNEILIFINIKKTDFNQLVSLIPKNISLKEFNKNISEQNLQIDERILMLIKLLYQESDSKNIEIESPFIYKPYIKLTFENPRRMCGKPLIPIGDSLLIGNPKVGNGLGTHFNFLRQIHDTLLYLYAGGNL